MVGQSTLLLLRPRILISVPCCPALCEARVRSLTLEYTYASEAEGALMGIEPLILRPAVL